MKHLNIASKQAKKSSHKQRLGAVLYSGSKVLGVGFNRVGESQHRLHTSHWPDSIHAEVAATVDALRKYPSHSLIGCDLLVVRLLKNDSYGLALPCSHCYNTLKHVGVRRIWFSTDENTFSMIRL